MMSLVGHFINITSSVLSFIFSPCPSLSLPPPLPTGFSFLHLLPLSHTLTLPSIHLTLCNPLTLPSSSSSTPLLISPLLSSLLLYQSLWQKINISSAAAFLPSLPRPSLLSLELIFSSAEGSIQRRKWPSVSSLLYR